MTVQLYLVGGWVRDKLLGVKSKDLDFAVEAPSYEALREEILRREGTIFLEKPEYLTIRAKLPKWGACDFVLCRKDGAYYDGRRPESVEPGTLLDDLARRDFTMNAIAMTEGGEYIDPFGGRRHIQERTIHCVGHALDRFSEDYLRMLRAIRFTVTKNMDMSSAIRRCLSDPLLARKLGEVAVERVREELLKAFRAQTLTTLGLLNTFPFVRDAVFPCGGLWLKPTLEER